MGGFEGADHLDPVGRPLDMAHAHGHMDQLEADYARAAGAGLRTVRESIGWRLCETAPGVFDLSRPLRMARCARRQGVQILWTLMHYGTPPDVDLREDAVIERFAAFAAAVAGVLGQESDEPPVYTLVNEISFLSWAVSHTNLLGAYQQAPGDAVQSTRSSGYEVKRRLVRATLAATDAVRRIDARARFLQVEPLVHVVAPDEKPELAQLAEQVASYQWQAWDLLAGKAEPGLGGSSDMLDLLGINHYHSGQWEVETERRLWWHARDPRRRGLDELLHDAWRRYRRPMLLSETSHVGAGRGPWLSDVASQVEQARAEGVPVLGVCLYPLVDRPDWNDAAAWHHSGLWDVAPQQQGAHTHLQRVLHRPYARMLALWQARLPGGSAPAPPRRTLLVFSHRRWTLEQHRTMHLMAHLASDHRIVFVEEPVHSAEAPRMVRSCPMPGIVVLQPHTACTGEGFDGPQLGPVCALLQQALEPDALASALAWVCTPTALLLVHALRLRPGVYDCVHAQPPGGLRWAVQEDRLLAQAALVFTAGPARARALTVRRADAVCLLNAVEAEHFAAHALQAGGSEDAEAARLLQGLGGPLIGHAGSFDASVDLELLAAIADARPQWQLVLIGPVHLPQGVLLPRRCNLHWLGAQPYTLLPFLLARLQVCLLPLARSARTELANPPQLLEYLAARKPVVSVPLPDVLELYGALVEVACDAAGFVRACEAALQRQHVDDLPRRAHVNAMLGRRSWKGAAHTVRGLLARQLGASE